MVSTPSEQHRADLALMQASLKGDPRATARLVQRLRCTPRILKVINRRLGAPLDDDALGDVVQEVALVLWRKRGEYEGRAKLETWVYRVAKLALLSACRRRAREDDRVHTHAARLEVRHATPPDLSGQEDSAALIEALERLGPPDADVIRLKHFEEQSFSQIGASLAVSPNTAKFWYYRGMEKLRQWLMSDSGEDAR